MKILIIEDEKPAARLLQRKIEKLGYPVEGMLHSVRQSIDWFSHNPHPDLIFLDIQLSDGLSFEIFETVSITSAIIFTTAYDEYALKAFKLNSIDYLLKPIDEEELQQAIEKYKGRFQQPSDFWTDIAQMKKLLLPDPSVKEYRKRFTVRAGQHLRVIPLEDIQCFFSEHKGTYAYTTEQRNYPLDLSLEQLEDELNPDDFFRVSRKYIVAMGAIKDIVVYSNSRLKIVLHHFGEEDIIVSRERVSNFKEWLQ